MESTDKMRKYLIPYPAWTEDRENPLGLPLSAGAIKYFSPSADKMSNDGNHRRQEARRKKMTRKMAVQVLMLSPLYFKLELASRNLLIKELCILYNRC